MSSLEAEAEKRKARLQALSKSLDKTGQVPDSLESENPTLKLQNYKAALEKESRFSSTRPSRLPQNDDITSNDQSAKNNREQDTIENSVAGVVEAAVAVRQEDLDFGELDISAIAPKRANWDLKRDLQKRLDDLKPINDAAVADIIRKRIQESSNLDELHSAVGAHSRG
ncbi:hypothetical protein H4R20_000329 [Coemansia guatemalensis]|uniref:Coiled-coil domain-containing protein 12 n=1 Tax=Coemansia guatemalensis TaxID=2761395 RepID=A0A9W8LVY8_9FUNG|nr:hypothetical protein H4R20_000329 [Coemansia guatemalensis]